MFDTLRIRQDFNAAAGRYDSHASLQNHVLKQLLGKLGPVKESASILDAGCGTGALARELNFKLSCHLREGGGLGQDSSLRGNDIVLIGLDSAERMCAQARKSGEVPVTGDMGRLPFACSQFDIVFSSLALQWATDWNATVNEWLRVLKPGGKIAFSTFAAGTLQELAESFGAADATPHVSDFIQVRQAISMALGKYQSETIIEHYPDMVSLARHLKALGARNKQQGKRDALMTPRQFRLAERYYSEHYGDAEGIPVSWNILYGIVEKP